ncbi:cyclodeaminase/cyclohydrolase family protein [Agrococcus sp. SL85]|uniref:cyclodeaminase/cyclohydrolase family protein n=1 Tax=Agrococcus sp. SL85 TaxID=2995141 RepID=UPI00226C9367|nr:cyclodeaminase/cyclohydrolase family protein [Agrococcus sp. SL85]WAC66079.1 cyclodeaminase/cyclohydrolase family protein [Agrococcus sp. SL85]
MSESLWTAPADELLRRTASAAPTPGGGSVAAISGAFGVGLVLMAIAVTDDAALDAHRARGEAILERVVPAADADVVDFRAVMAAYGLPRGDEAERAARTAAIQAASVDATGTPLALVEALVDALRLAAEVEPLVKRSIVSDVHAGADLVAGAARAAVRTADINLVALERGDAPAAAGLRARRDALVAALEEAA